MGGGGRVASRMLVAHGLLYYAKANSNECCFLCTPVTANTKHSPNAVSKLAHCLRRWLNTKTAIGECLVFAGIMMQGTIAPFSLDVSRCSDAVIYLGSF